MSSSRCIIVTVRLVHLKHPLFGVFVQVSSRKPSSLRAQEIARLQQELKHLKLKLEQVTSSRQQVSCGGGKATWAATNVGIAGRWQVRRATVCFIVIKLLWSV
jgi:hypothetical protein